MKNILIPLIIFLLSQGVQAQPPEPPLGKRWIFNEKFSDEFNGTELDLTKWYDYHPTWKGRPPGLFLPSQVKVANGYLTIRGERMDKDTVITNWDGSKNTYYIAAGAVVSRTQEAFYGYYECRFKAAKTTMSTTFWLSSRGTEGQFPGPEPCNDKYSLELDIQECIGREGAFDGSYFAKGMHSNSHVHYTDCDGIKHDYRASQVLFESDELASDGFNTYGGWWKNENDAIFYYNNGPGKAQKFFTGLIKKPFDRPMGVNLVSETYPYPWISLPTNEELADTSKNICYYDWVRAYTLEDVDFQDPVTPLVQNGGFETGDFRYWTGWGGDPLEVVSNNQNSGNYCAHIGGPGAPEYQVYLKRKTDYTLSCYGKAVSGTLILGIKDNAETYFGSVTFTGTEYEKKSFDFNTGASTIFKFYYYAQGSGDEGYADDFELVEKNPGGGEEKETFVFPETIYFSEAFKEKTARSTIDFVLTYKANADREINLQLFNPAGTLVGQQKYTALGGYGKKRFLMQLDSVPRAAGGYLLLADIRPVDSSYADTFQTARYAFDLLNPADVNLSILDKRDDSPVAGADVIVGDTTKSTDSSGKVTFYSISVGPLPVRIEKEGYLEYSSAEDTVRSDTSLSIRLTPVPYILTLFVYNDYTGESLGNASIHMDDKTTLTDHEGKSIRSIPSGIYPAEISREGYADKSLSIAVNGDTSIYIALRQVLADVKFVVMLDSSSLMGANVSVGDRSVITSSVGLAVFPDMKTDTGYVYRVEYLSSLLASDTLVLRTDTTLWLYINTSVFSGPDQRGVLQAFPNPASTEIRIEGIEEPCEFAITGIQGGIVRRGRLEKPGLIDVSGLSTGIYILILGDKGTLKFCIYNQ